MLGIERGLDAIARAILAMRTTALGFNKNTGGVLAAGWVTYATVTTTSKGGECYANWTAQIANGNSGAHRTCDVRVQCDGVTVDSVLGLFIPLFAPNTSYFSYGAEWSSTPAAGAHTWTLQFQPGTASAIVLAGNTLKITEKAF